MFAQLNVRTDILLSCEKHMHDGIISLRGEVWAYQTGLNTPLLKCLYQARKMSGHVCVLEVSILTQFL